jgi:hypothetical protein
MRMQSAILLSVLTALLPQSASAADYTIKAGSTDVSVYFIVNDAGGTPTSVAYTRNGDTTQPLTPSTALASANSAHTDNKWFVVQADINSMGMSVLRYDLPDAVCAGGKSSVAISLVTDSPVISTLRIDLVGYDTMAANLPANVTQISGDDTAADNAESYFDGSGYGVHLRRTAITDVSSNTEWEVSSPPGNAQGFKNCRIMLHKGTSRYLGYATNVNGAGVFTVVWSNLTPTVQVGDVVEIFLPDTAEQIQSSVTAAAAGVSAISAKLPSKSRLAGTNNSDGDIQLDEATGNASANVVQINGDGSAADNAKSHFGGTGFGPILLQSAITGNPASGDTVIELSSASAAQSDGAYNGCLVVVSSTNDGEAGGVTRSVRYVTDYEYDSGAGTLTLNASPDFNLDSGGMVTILTPGFVGPDRSAASDVATDVEALLDYFANAPTFAAAMDGHGYTTVRAEKVDKLAPTLLASTTISSLTNQTTFALAAGPPDDDALNGALVIVTDGSHKAVGVVANYVQSTKTVTLASDPGIFTMGNGDQVDIVAIEP